MSRTTIGCVIATPGRRSLVRTLNSIQYQGLIEGDDVLVVGDGFHEPTKEIVEAFGPPFRYIATEKTRDWGHSQQNYGLQHVRGDWLLLQDDDDIFLPRAFDEARAIVAKLETPRPVIGRVITPFLGILWTAPQKEPLDGHCLLVPNDKAKLGYFGNEYAGDQRWLSSNLEAYDTYTWADRIWTYTRPSMTLWPILGMWRAGEMYTFDFNRGKDAPDANWVVRLFLFFAPMHETWRVGWLKSAHATHDELLEVAQFVAWAGQGTDVEVILLRTQRDEIAAFREAGFKTHVEAPEHVELVYEWPPRRFVPPENKKEEEAKP